ncbi:MAG: ABC transporter permease [Pseudomonadota bacterium]
MSAQIPTIRRRSQFKAAVDDITLGAKMWPIWLALSWEEFKTTYSRSILGFLWVTLSFAGFVFVKLLVFSSMLSTPDQQYYNAYLVSGFFIWQFITASVSSAPGVFLGSQTWIKNDALPLSLYVYKTVAREFYNLVLTSVVVVAAFLYIGYRPGPYALMTIPAIVLILINAVWVKILLGIVGTRHRDVAHFVRAVMFAMLFLVPIFWLPEQIGRLYDYLWWNPILHFMQIFRNPLIDPTIDWQYWIFSGVVTIVGIVVTLLAYTLARRRIVFWF